MNTVFEPAMVFIPDDEWAVEAKRDQFLEHLLGHLQCVETLATGRLYWTNGLEEHLWNSPHLPPWRRDRDFKIPLVPVVYRTLTQCRDLLDTADCNCECWIDPPIQPVEGRQSACAAFRQLMHFLLVRQEAVHLCVGLRNRLGDGKARTFSCACHGHSLSLYALEAPDDWLTKLDWVDAYWPRAGKPEELSRLRRALAIAGGWRPGQPEPRFEYEYGVTAKFLGNIADEGESRSSILESMVSRLRLTQAQAGRDGGLKDESVKGQARVRRFRVTGAARIHYQYEDSGRLIFTDYFGEGKHDEGL